MDMREEFTIDGRHFSTMTGFYDEVEPVSYTHLLFSSRVSLGQRTCS